MRVGEHAHPQCAVEDRQSTPGIPAICSVNASASRIRSSACRCVTCSSISTNTRRCPISAKYVHHSCNSGRSSAASARRCGYVRTGWAWRGWPAEPPRHAMPQRARPRNDQLQSAPDRRRGAISAVRKRVLPARVNTTDVISSTLNRRSAADTTADAGSRLNSRHPRHLATRGRLDPPGLVIPSGRCGTVLPPTADRSHCCNTWFTRYSRLRHRNCSGPPVEHLTWMAASARR